MVTCVFSNITYLSGKETKVQRTWMTCPRPNKWQVAEERLWTGPIRFNVPHTQFPGSVIQATHIFHDHLIQESPKWCHMYSSQLKWHSDLFDRTKITYSNLTFSNFLTPEPLLSYSLGEKKYQAIAVLGEVCWERRIMKVSSCFDNLGGIHQGCLGA